MADTVTSLQRPLRTPRFEPRLDLKRLLASAFGWIAPALLVAVWQASASLGWLPDSLLPSPFAVLAAGWRLTLSGELPRNVEVSFLRALRRARRRRRDRLRLRARQRPFAAQRPLDRHDPADGAQHPASRADSPGHRLVRHRRGGEAVPGRARRVLPHLRQYAAWRALGRPAARRDGEELRHAAARAVSPRHPARRPALDLRRPALRAGDHVADADRRRDDRGAIWRRLHGDAGARIPADRRRRAGDRDLRAARQTRRRRRACARALVPPITSAPRDARASPISVRRCSPAQPNWRWWRTTPTPPIRNCYRGG